MYHSVSQGEKAAPHVTRLVQCTAHIPIEQTGCHAKYFHPLGEKTESFEEYRTADLLHLLPFIDSTPHSVVTHGNTAQYIGWIFM